MATFGAPGPVGIPRGRDQEEDRLRIEETSEMELNVRATELLLPPDDRDRLGVFADINGRLWLARLDRPRTRGDPRGLTWYGWEDPTPLIERRARALAGPHWSCRDPSSTLDAQLRYLADEDLARILELAIG